MKFYASKQCRWAGSSAASKLLTGSYDGSLRCLDPSTGSFDLIVSSEEAEFSAMDCSMDGNLAIMGDNDGYLHTFDIRANKGSQRGKEAELHNKRINTLHVSHPPAYEKPQPSLSALECARAIQ